MKILEPQLNEMKYDRLWNKLKFQSNEDIVKQLFFPLYEELNVLKLYISQISLESENEKNVE